MSKQKIIEHHKTAAEHHAEHHGKSAA